MPYRITVINDDEPFLELMQTLLEETGYDVDLLRESTKAHGRVKDLKPDAIVLDLRMEKPDTGWQLLELLRLDPDLATVPVILCSADVTRLHERQQALAAHNCRVLDKPFHLDELLGVLREILPSPV